MTEPAAAVLLIDDNPDHRDLIGGALEDAGFTCRTAESGAEARQRLAEAPADLVLLDYSLGEETGFDVLLWMREEHPRRPVVLLTGHGSEELAVQALQRGAVDFLVKSLDAGFMQVLPLYVSKNLERARLEVALGRAEADRAHQEAYRRLVLDSLDAVVVSVDEHFRITDVNRAFGELAKRLGASLGEAIGRRFDEALPSAPIVEALQAMRTSLALGEASLLRREVVINDAPGGAMELDLEATPLARAEQGEGVVVVLTDTTEPRRARREQEALNARIAEANDELQRLAGARTDLVQAVCKELRSPAQSIGGYAKMLESGRLGDLGAKAVSAVGTIARGADRLAGLADDLDYLAAEPSDSSWGPPIGLGPILEAALEAGSAARRERKIRVRRDWPAELPSVRGDVSRLDALLKTLLTDVAEDSGERSMVQCRVTLTGGEVIIRLQDDGSRSLEDEGGPLQANLRLDVAMETARRHGGQLERIHGGAGGRRGWELRLPTATRD